MNEPTKEVEVVILVDENNNILGTKPKAEVHGAETPLHRAFSSFIFNNKGELLLQQRSRKKKTWPLFWSNSCCGHPKVDENNTDAVRRRCIDELGLTLKHIEEVSPFRYQAVRDGVMENEICPILVGLTGENHETSLNDEEVEAIQWVKWEDFLNEIASNKDKYSPWCIEEVEILEKNERFLELFQ